MGGLGPGGLDSDWIPLSERDCYLSPIECQTTGTQTSNLQLLSGKTNIAMENPPFCRCISYWKRWISID